MDVPRRVSLVRRETWTALALAMGLLVYGNALSALPDERRDGFLLWSNLGLLALLLAWAIGVARFSLAEVGLDPKAAPASAVLGVAVSFIVALPLVAFVLLAPVLTGGPVEAEGITERSSAGMAYFLLFRQPIGTALFEEAAFRGVLYAAWQRAGGDRMAFLATSVAFSLWHITITSRTVAESGVVNSPAGIVSGVVISLAGLLLGGLIFAYIRWHTRSIAAAAVAHWLIVAFMTAAVWAIG